MPNRAQEGRKARRQQRKDAKAEQDRRSETLRSEKRSADWGRHWRFEVCVTIKGVQDGDPKLAKLVRKYQW